MRVQRQKNLGFKDNLSDPPFLQLRFRFTRQAFVRSRIKTRYPKFSSCKLFIFNSDISSQVMYTITKLCCRDDRGTCKNLLMAGLLQLSPLLIFGTVKGKTVFYIYI